MRSESVLSKSFAISLLFHAGLLGGLILFVSKAPVVSETPLSVRILGEPSSGAVPQPPGAMTLAPQPGPFDELKARREPVETPRRSNQLVRPEIPTERLTPRPVPGPDKPPSTLRQAQGSGQAPSPLRSFNPSTGSGLRAQGSGQAAEVAPPAVPPQVAPRPEPEMKVSAPTPTEPSADPPRQSPRESARSSSPERSGLVLGGPSESVPALPPASVGPAAKGSPRPSLRDQIASLGSNVFGEADEAKRSVNLDDRRPEYSPYLERLKRRVYSVWTSPPVGFTGEVLLIFTLNKAGTLTNLRLARSSGFPILDNDAIRTIRAAAPFDPIPPEWGDEPLFDINASFLYLPPYRYRRN